MIPGASKRNGQHFKPEKKKKKCVTIIIGNVRTFKKANKKGV